MTYNFYMFICHLYVFFAEVSIKIFGQFSIGLFVYHSTLKVLWIFRRYSFITSVFYKYFFPFCGLSFHSLDSFFNRADIFNFIMKLGLSILFSWIVPLVLLLFSDCVVPEKLWLYGLQHSGLLCPSLSSGVCSNSCPLRQWSYLTISSSAAPFSSGPQSPPVSGSVPMSQLFSSGGQSINPSVEYLSWLPLGLSGLIPCSPRDSQESSIAITYHKNI